VFEDPSFGLLFRSAAERYFGILEEIENAILRELYTPILNPRVKGRGSRKECIYVSFEEARAEAVKIHGGEGKMLEFVFGVQSEDYEVDSRNRGTRRLSSADVLDEDENLRANVRGVPQLGDLEPLEDLPKCLALRGCTSFPWLDEKRGWTEEGVWCKGVLRMQRIGGGLGGAA
jgi:hypothetical protein